MTQETLFGPGEWAEWAITERINADRLDRLEQALALAGIRPGTLPHNVAMIIFNVPKNTGGKLEWTNQRIADDQWAKKRNGKSPSEKSVVNAVSRLRGLGIVEQEIEPDKAIRWIDHARVLRIVETGSIDQLAPKCEVTNDLTNDLTMGSQMGSQKSSAIISSLTPRTFNPTTVRKPEPEVVGEVVDSSEDECRTPERFDSNEEFQATLKADLDALTPVLKVLGSRDKSKLRGWLMLVYHGHLDERLFGQWLGLVNSGYDESGKPIRSPLGFINHRVNAEMEVTS